MNDQEKEILDYLKMVGKKAFRGLLIALGIIAVLWVLDVLMIMFVNN
jgi:hypothetical protein